MANEIERKDLFDKGLRNITQSDWIRVAGKLNISVLKSQSGTSHYISLRDSDVVETESLKGFITTVLPNLYKQANRSIFKSVLKYVKSRGLSEDDLWKALGLL